MADCNDCSIKKTLYDCYDILKNTNEKLEGLLAETIDMKLKLEKKYREAVKGIGEKVFPSNEDFYAELHKQSVNYHERNLSIITELTGRINEEFAGKRVLFIIPLGIVTGGGNVIVQEAATLRRFGIDARILNLESERELYQQNYGHYNVPTFFVEDFESAPGLCYDYDLVCATSWQTVFVAHFDEISQFTRTAYYVQDYEPSFYEDESSNEYQWAKATYTMIPNMRLVTKTNWNHDIVKQETGAECTVLGSCVNTALFGVNECKYDGKIRIAAMVRPHSPLRAPELTMRVLKRVYDRYKDNVEIHIFGSNLYDDADFFIHNETDFGFINHQITDSKETAEILSKADIFADFSVRQAMGLTGLEAMLSGCAVIVPKDGGAVSYAKDRINSLVIDTVNENECFEAIETLINNRDLREKISFKAIEDAQEFCPEKCAAVFAETCLR